jgi:hypothetical protein
MNRRVRPQCPPTPCGPTSRPSARYLLPHRQDVPDPGEQERESATKKAKLVDGIKKDVRELLDKKLMGKDDKGRVEALRALVEYFRKGESSDSEYQQKSEHRRAVSEWDGCHLV